MMPKTEAPVPPPVVCRERVNVPGCAAQPSLLPARAAGGAHGVSARSPGAPSAGKSRQREGWGRWTRRLGVAVALVVAGCGGGRDFVDKRLETLDAAYRKRGSAEQLNDAVRGYLQLNERFAGDPRVLGRLARAYTVRAELGHGDDRLRDYSTAREFGLECLMLRGSFAGLVTANGGMVVPEAARELTEEDVGCIVWTVIPWARWVHERGASGVGLDHDVLIALAGRAVELNERWGRGRSQYALGLAKSLPPDVLDPKLDQAAKAFKGAMEVAPDRLAVPVDYALHVLRRTGAEDEAEVLLRRVAETGLADDESDRAENEAAIQTAREVLGLPPRSDTPSAAGEDGAEDGGASSAD